MKDYRKLISKHRSAIMGLMALLIIIYHAEWTTNINVYDMTINKFGSIGVDVFVFISGFGLAYALTKYDDFATYIIKRFGRILPAYYTFEIINFIIALLLLLVGIKNNLLQPIESWLIPVGVWVNYDSHKWYIAGILGFYILAALIYPAMRRSKYLYLTVFFMLLITVLFVPFIADMSNMPLAVERIPALVIGLSVGVASLRKESKYKKTSLGLIYLIILCVIGISMYFLQGKLPGTYLSKLVDESNIYVRQSLIAPLLAVLLAYIIELFGYIHLNFIDKGLAWLGKLSLELYLIHTLISGILGITSLSKPLQVLITIILSVPAAMLLKWLSNKVLNLWRKLSKHLLTNDNNTMINVQNNQSF